MIPYKLIPEKNWTDVNRKLQKLSSDITSATEFVREIERGNLDVSLGTDSSDSELKTSLVNMRDQMKKYSLTEKQRNWVNEGLAKFVQILRSTNNEGTQTLSDNIIRNLVVYLKANQGILFAVNDDNANDVYLELEACYAYDRKKFFEKRIALGEGLAGQVVLEKSTLYMTDVPKDFVKITSGLGEALPRNILLVPLKLDEKVYGVVELASFQIFESFEIEFVERLGESIASAIAAVKNNDRTRTLLKETQLQAEQLKAQEEEVRQNLEELSATQEAMQRAMREVEGKEAYISQILNTSQDLIYTVDRDFRMVMWNAMFAREAARINVKLEKGMNAFEWSPDDRKKLVSLYTRVLNGESFEMNYDADLNGKKYYFLSVYAPIKSVSGEIIEAGVYARDVTAMIETQHESARLLKDAQQQAEQLKAQEEELRQNMEELSATQEAMERAMKDVEMKETYVKQILDTSQDIIYTVDSHFRMATWNARFAHYLELAKVRLERGMNAFEWSPDDRQKLVALYTRVFNGETFEITYEITVEGIRYHYLSVYAPIKSASGEIVEAAIYARDVTSIVDAQQQSARLLKEAQQQSEQLKAQEEELRQNMEELSATQEEVVRKQEQANKLLQKFELVTKTTTEGLWDMEVPKDNTITDDTPFFWADRFRHMLGYKDENDFPNVLHAWSDLLHPDHKQKTLDAFGAHLYDLSGETPYDVEYQLKLKEGSYRWFRAIGNTMRDEKGNPLRVAGSLIDIQGLKDIQELQLELESKVARRTEELKESLKEVEAKELYGSQILNTAKDTIYTVDADYRFATWNSMFARAAEAHNIQVEKGMNAFEWSPADRQNLIALYKRVFNGETFELTYEMELSGTKYHFLSLYAPIKSPAGEIIEAAIYAKDITEVVEAKQEAEKLARETKAREEYLSQLLNASRDVIFSVDREFKLTTWNEAFAKTVAGFGIRPHKGMIAFEWRPDEERAHFVELFKRVFNDETFESTAESKFDGKTQQFLSTFTPLKDKEGEIIEALAIARDITSILNEAKSTAEPNGSNRARERKEKNHTSNGKNQANGEWRRRNLDNYLSMAMSWLARFTGTGAELRNTERVMSQIKTLLPGVSYRFQLEPEFRLTHVGDGVYDLLGFKPKELLNENRLSYLRIIHPEHEDIILKKKILCRQGHEPKYLQYHFLNKSRSVIPVDDHFIGEYDSSGQLIAINGYVRERRKSSGRLQLLNQLDAYRAAIDVNMISSVTDAFGTIIYANENFKKVSGYSDEELLGKNTSRCSIGSAS